MTITCIPLFHIRGGSLFFHAVVPCRTPTVPKPERPGSKKRKRDSGHPVRVISGSENPAYKAQFLRCARSLGFKMKKITDGLRDAEDLVVEVPEPFVEGNDGVIIKRRSGTPYTNAYKQFRTQLFLPTSARSEKDPVSTLPSCLSSGICSTRSPVRHLAAETLPYQLHRLLSLSQWCP
jgi:hypothetical protein